MDIAIISLICKILIDLRSGLWQRMKKVDKLGPRGVQIAETVRMQKCVGWLFHYMMTHLPSLTSVVQAEGENDQGL